MTHPPVLGAQAPEEPVPRAQVPETTVPEAQAPEAPPTVAGGVERRTYSLAGPLCTSLDRIGTAELAPVQPGDLLVFGQVGAYGFTQAMTNFLSHPVPEQVWLGGSTQV